jgi:hypothetical protein
MLKARTDVLFVDVHETSIAGEYRRSGRDVQGLAGPGTSITPMLKERGLMVSATSTRGE